jgi:hypothetical protein
VASQRSQDITIQEFSLETEDPNHYFPTLLSLAYGRKVSVSSEGKTFIRSVCAELHNCELFELTFEPSDELGGEIEGAELRARLEFLSRIDGNCQSEVQVVASHFYAFSVSDFDDLSASVLHVILSDGRLVVRDEDSLFEVIHRLASKDLSYFGLLEFVRFEFLSDACMKAAFDFIHDSFDGMTRAIWSALEGRLALSVKAPSAGGRFFLPSLDSKIVTECPVIFGRFRAKEFRLLYRGSRDGFGAANFHTRCNGHRHTVTLILSTDGWIFGGYTPVAWNSRGTGVADPTRQSFVFTIKNPHNLRARVFIQKAEDNAINDKPSYGPIFGGGHDLVVCDNCRNANSSWSSLGTTSENDTQIAGNQILTGAYNFTVQEIEIFELA